MTKTLLMLVVSLSVFTAQVPIGCVGAITRAVAQERGLPQGHICVDVGRSRSPDMHECACHHGCTDDEHPDVVVENAACLVYCTPSQCKCQLRGCP